MVTYLYGAPPGKRNRKRIAIHNGGIGSQYDHMLRNKYKKRGWKNFKSVDVI